MARERLFTVYETLFMAYERLFMARETTFTAYLGINRKINQIISF